MIPIKKEGWLLYLFYNKKAQICNKINKSYVSMYIVKAFEKFKLTKFWYLIKYLMDSRLKTVIPKNFLQVLRSWKIYNVTSRVKTKNYIFTTMTYYLPSPSSLVTYTSWQCYLSLFWARIKDSRIACTGALRSSRWRILINS